MLTSLSEYKELNVVIISKYKSAGIQQVQVLVHDVNRLKYILALCK